MRVTKEKDISSRYPLIYGPTPEMNDNKEMDLAWQCKLNEVNTEIKRMTLAVSQTPDDHPNMLRLLLRLGESHDEQFDLADEPSDIDKAIEYTAMALTLTPDSDQDLPLRLANQGMYHGKRFERLGEVDDNDKAIEYVSQAVGLTPQGHPEFSGMLANLAVFYKNRFERLGQLSGLETAIEYESRAVSMTPSGHPDLSARLQNLGVSHTRRYERLGKLGDLERAIEHQSRAVELTPDSDLDLSARLQNLGVSLVIRYERLGELGDLERAIEHQSRAVALTPDGHPKLSARLQNLGSSFRRRYERLGELGDLDRAIGHESRAVALTPDGHPALSGRLQNLGVSLRRRYERLGELGDLDRAIEHESRTVELTPDGHPGLSGRLQNHGVSLKIRYERLGELDDLERAIEHQSRAVALTPDGHPRLSARLQNLGGSHTRRYERLGKLGDLERAIDHQSRAVALTPNDHPDFSTILQSLGVSLRRRYERLGEVGDVDKAIEYQSRAVALTPNDHPDLSGRLHNLGKSHFRRFHRLHNQQDLDSAIEWTACSIQLIPPGHLKLPDIHFPLALYRRLQYRLMGDPSDLQDSLYSYRMAAQSSSGSPRDKFRYAVAWAKDASVETYLNPIEAYQTAINLLPQFIWLGATTVQRYQDLESAGSLAVDAAVAAIHASDNRLALEWLEHARCVVWSQSLMLRSPLDELHSCDPDLATRLRSVADQLHHAGSDSRESQSLASGSLTPEQVAQQHRQFAQEYDNLISQARTLPGFSAFLKPTKVTSLVPAARNGPIVVINCHNDRCDALIVMPGQDHVGHVPLPRFTSKEANNTRKQMQSAVRETRQRERKAELWSDIEQKVGFESILAGLWYGVVKPVLDFLGLPNNPPPINPPHITWCPTGALSFLPLHAAGDYEQPGSRVFDYVISSYTPTLNAILPSASTVLSVPPRLLAISQPNTPGHTPLPGTAEELEYLNKHISDKFEHTQLIGDQATTTSVLDAMEQHDWVHLACHAHQNVQDSTKSGFFLHDGTLDLAAINRRSFKNKGLAFLSACQTATGDEKLPDEAIHLASGMLMAGYSSVIATMWSVMDDDAPFVADKVYGQLMKEGKVGNGEAGKALHYAVAELREKVGERKFGRWVPYIHIGS